MSARFSPEILLAGAVKRLMRSLDGSGAGKQKGLGSIPLRLSLQERLWSVDTVL